MREEIKIARTYMIEHVRKGELNAKSLATEMMLYIQNNSISFHQGSAPSHKNGVLTFTAVGKRSEHERMIDELGETLYNLGCHLELID